MSPGGNQILYSTYLGGSGFDGARAIVVDSNGNAYVTGNGSPDFPTTPGAFMSSCTSLCNTPFIAKILSDGSLAYSTFVGGSNVAAWSIAVDSAGAAYITGSAASGDLPLMNPFQATPAGGFVQKLNPTGSALEYSTYLGGGGDWGRSIAVDSVGSIYVVGSTSATNFPLKNPLQSSPVGGPFINTAFITKFSSDGGSLVFSTYLGGSSPFFFDAVGDYATGVAVDSLGNVHVVGTSSSCDFPLSLNAFSTDCVNTSYDQKVFVVTLNPSGSQILFSTLLQSGFASGIAADKNGNSYVTGSTASDYFPLVNAIETTSQRTASSNIIANSFIAELDLSGKLLFSTYLGGQNGSQPAGIAVDGQGRIYVAGTGSGDFPILHPILKELQPPCCYGIFAARISPSKVPQFSLSPRTSPILSLRNVSSVALEISGITPSSNFLKGGDCGASLAPGTGCTLILQGAADNKTSGTVTISSNASTTPQKFVIAKSPLGDSVGPIDSITPSSITFPLQFVGSSSVPQQLTLKNAGMQPSTISNISISVSGDFKETNNCPAVLPVSTSCKISLTYKPSTASNSYAQLGITHDQLTDYVFPNGFGSSSAIAASTNTVEFGSQFVGQPPLGRIVNFTNPTPYPATITGISTTPGFAQTNTCTAPVPPHGGCRAFVTFVPPVNLTVNGSLTAANFGPGGAQTVSLIGTGVLISDLSVSPFQLDFYSQFLGSTDSQTVTLTNISSQPMTGFKFSSNSSSFSQTNNCPATLAAGASCPMNAIFKPKQVGPTSGAISIQHSGAGSPQVVNMTGSGMTALSFSPSPLVFPQQKVGTANTNVTLGIGNISARSVTLTSITVQGTDFKLGQDSCPATLLRNVGCFVQIIFKPTATGLRTGTVTVIASDSSQAHIVQLQGTGTGNGQGKLSVASLSFSAQTVGTTSAAKQVKLTNSGTGTLHLGQISASPSFFLVSTNCTSSLVVGSSCAVSVRFAPTLAGILAGTLTINDDGLNSPHTVSLTGIGQ